jgi:hypothetical protein
MDGRKRGWEWTHGTTYSGTGAKPGHAQSLQDGVLVAQGGSQVMSSHYKSLPLHAFGGGYK